MMKCMNKKGDEENLNRLLGIILGVLGLLLIAFVAYSLYYAFVNQESENAKNTLSVIEAKINALDSSSELDTSKYPSFPIRTVKDWGLYGWGPDNSDWQYRPDKCYFGSCVCMCPFKDLSFGQSSFSYDTEGGRNNLKSVRDICQQKGFCSKFNFDSILFSGPIIFPSDFVEIGIAKERYAVPANTKSMEKGYYNQLIIYLKNA